MEEKKNRARRENQGGFTLIELMIVITILAVLASIVVPKMISSADESYVAAAKAQITLFKTPLTQYRLWFKQYPSTAEGLEALISNSKSNLLDVDSPPFDPWGNPYFYESPGSHGHDYEITSYGADGTSGGDSYNADIISWNLAASH